MRTVPIRVSLTASILALVLLLAVAILVVNVLAARRIAEDLADRYLSETERRVEEQIDSLFQPVVQSLEHARDWSRDGVVDPMDILGSARVYRPMLASYPWISSIATGDDGGTSWRMGAEAEGFLVRVVNAADAQAPARFWQLDAEGAVQREYTEPNKFDPRTRPWFTLGKEALDKAGSAEAASVVWTEPFVLNTSQTPGIGAVLPFSRAGGEPYVVTFNVMLSRLSEFTAGLRPTQRGVALVLSEEGEVIGFPAHPKYPDAASRQALVKSLDDKMPTLRQMGLPAFDAFAERWDAVRAAGVRTTWDFVGLGEPWRLGIRPHDLPGGLKLWIGVALPEADFLGEVKAQRTKILWASAAAVLLGMGVALALARAYARPLKQLAEASDRITTLDLTPGEPVRTHLLEAQRLAESQERMRGALDSFARYVPTPVVKELVRQGEAARLGGETRPLTLMFSDVRGFTTISEGLTPEALTAHLARYFERLMDIVAEHGGAVDKMIGDAVMSLWGAPVAYPDHAARALRAALASEAWLQAFNARCVAEGKPPLKTGFGLCTGSAFVGNIGSPTRLNYTALGDTVNLASRLEGTSKVYGVNILCDESVKEAAGPDFVWRCLDVVAVKGKDRPTRVYEPLGEQGTVEPERLAFARAYEAALEDYLARRFEAARARLEALVAPWRDEVSVQRLIGLCRALAAAPPPPDWDGVARMTSK